MRIAAAVYEEAVGIVAIGQLHGKRFDPVRLQTLGELTGGLLPAAIGIGIERQMDGAHGAVAKLANLSGIQARSQRAGDVVQSCLPQDRPIEHAFHQYDLAALTNPFPVIQPTLAAGQESMWGGVADAASVEVGIERKDDAMSKGIEAFERARRLAANRGARSPCSSTKPVDNGRARSRCAFARLTPAVAHRAPPDTPLLPDDDGAELGRT